jgi:hypothetical protein
MTTTSLCTQNPENAFTHFIFAYVSSVPSGLLRIAEAPHQNSETTELATLRCNRVCRIITDYSYGLILIFEKNAVGHRKGH